MTWMMLVPMMLVPLWCLALVAIVALCRAGHLEDVARGYVDDLTSPLGPVRVRQEALPLAQ